MNELFTFLFHTAILGAVALGTFIVWFIGIAIFGAFGIYDHTLFTSILVLTVAFFYFKVVVLCK